MTDRPDIDWSFGHSLRIDAGSRLLDTAWQNEARYARDDYSDDPGEFFKILLAGNWVGGNTVAVRRAALLEAGGWDENVACQDWGLWLRLAHHGKRRAPLPLPCLPPHPRPAAHHRPPERRHLRPGPAVLPEALQPPVASHAKEINPAANVTGRSVAPVPAPDDSPLRCARSNTCLP
jgi:hypothetical protein